MARAVIREGRCCGAGCWCEIPAFEGKGVASDLQVGAKSEKTVASGVGYRAAAMFAPERRGGKIKFRLALPDGASHSFP